MGTTREDVLAAAQKLVDDAKAQGDAIAAKVAADGVVTNALQDQAAASAGLNSAHAQTTADIADLLDKAQKLTDDDDAT